MAVYLEVKIVAYDCTIMLSQLSRLSARTGDEWTTSYL